MIYSQDYVRLVIVVFLMRVSSITSGCVDKSGPYCTTNKQLCNQIQYKKSMIENCRLTCNFCNITRPSPKTLLPSEATSTITAGQTLKTVVTATITKQKPTVIPGRDLQPTCGLRPRKNSFVVGGRNAIRSWPWQVNVDYAYHGNPGHYCGGTLISDEWVLSAAHCFIDNMNKEKYTIVMGDHTLHQKNGREKYFKIAQLILHPRYNDTSLDNDLALVRLERKVRFNRWISPACLPDEYVQYGVGTMCYVTGWGTMSKYNRVSPVLQEAQVPLSDIDACNKTYSTPLHKQSGYAVTDSMLCTGTRNGTVDPCYGDSGGPLVCKSRMLGREVWYLWGVVSWGEGCARKGFHTVYANVKEMGPWIKNIVFTSKYKARKLIQS